MNPSENLSFVTSSHLLATLLIIFLLTACAKTDLTDTEYLEQARHYRTSGDIAAAVISLKNALQRNASNSEARFLLGQLYLEMGDGASAEKEIRRMMPSQGADSDIYIHLGKALLLQLQFQSVLDEIPLPADENEQNAAQLYAIRGEAYLGLFNSEGASQSFHHAERLQANSVPVLLGLVRLAIYDGDYTKAHIHLSHALTLEPASPDAWYLQGELAFKQLQYDKAEEAYNNVIKLSHKNVLSRQLFASYVGLTRSELAQKKYDSAQNHIDQLLKLVPENPIPHYLAALLAFQTNDRETVLLHLQAVLRRTPDHAPSLLLIGATHYAMENYEQADLYLSRFLQYAPEHIQARKLLGAVRIKQNRHQDAIEILSPMATSTDDAQLLAIIGRASLHIGDLEQGSEFLKRAASASPGDPSIRSELANMYVRQGAYNQAIDELKNITNSDANQTQIQLIHIYLKKQDYNTSRKLAAELATRENNNPAIRTLQGGVELLAGERAAARFFFNAALTLQNDFTPARLNLAQMDLEENQLKSATNQFNRVLSTDPDNIAAMLGLAKIAEINNQRTEAISWLTKARDADNSALIPALVLGKYYLQTGQVDRALTIAEDTAALHGNNPDALLLLARSYAVSGNATSALSTYRRLINILPDNPAVYLELAKVQLDRNRPDEARRSLQKALEIDKSYDRAAIALALLELRHGNINDAIKYAEDIRQRTPESPHAHALLGDIYMVDKQYHKARRYYANSYRIEPTTAVLDKLAHSYSLLGNHSKATKLLEDWLSTHPDDIQIQFSLASTFQSIGQPAQARKIYLTLLGFQPENPTVLNNLALIEAGSNPSKALAYAEKAYRISPSNPDIMDTLGWLLVEQGNPVKGGDLLSKAASISSNPTIHYHYAVALMKQGDEAAAKEKFAGLLQTGVGFPEKEQAAKYHESLTSLEQLP